MVVSLQLDSPVLWQKRPRKSIVHCWVVVSTLKEYSVGGVVGGAPRPPALGRQKEKSHHSDCLLRLLIQAFSSSNFVACPTTSLHLHFTWATRCATICYCLIDRTQHQLSHLSLSRRSTYRPSSKQEISTTEFRPSGVCARAW